jgi:demethylmenaquinone methyltransferase/2-methoxy-6-polyprenyl-1,4-benzoquinol methylase
MVTLCCGDALWLPYSDNYFNGIIMAFTIETFVDTEIYALLRQCKRVLKADGRIVVVSMSQQGNPGIMMKIYRWAHVTFPKVVDCRPIYLEETLRTAGFDISEATVSTFWGLSVEIVEARIAGAKLDRVDV